jgi:hypothetical protein
MHSRKASSYCKSKKKIADESAVRVTPPPYTLSFTVGGLFLFEGIELARLRATCPSWEEVRRSAPDGVFVAKGGGQLRQADPQ